MTNSTNATCSADIGRINTFCLPQKSTVIIQEDEIGFCAVDGQIHDNHGGFTGTGFSNSHNSAGSGIDWKFYGASTTYTFKWRYANGTPNNRTSDIIINGSTVGNVDFLTTSSWTNWDTSSVTISNIASGTKSIRLESVQGSGLPNIDYLEVIGNGAVRANCSDPIQVVEGNGAVYISVSGDSSITWSNGADSEDINGLSAGTYYVTATNNICEVIDSFTIIDIISPSLSATSTHATCNLDNGSIDLSISDGTAPFTYDWEHIVGTDDGQDVGNIGEGTYAVTVSDANGCTDSMAVVSQYHSDSFFL